ncbi:hypothetical protein [Asaia bogorensis]|uniref:hypothetical protein n=1 Tax=Asaia bogorensis TaxID=91915 RepID=UPI000EFA6F3C|nr:hypothetical protein [Asaia bogorensis]
MSRNNPHSLTGNAEETGAAPLDAYDVLYTLETDPPQITALLTETGVVVSRCDARWGTPDGIWLDRTHIYWTNMGADYNVADGTIERARHDGSAHEVLVGHGLVVTPKQLAADPQAGWLYWCDREGMRIMRSRFDGADLQVLLQNGTYPRDTRDITRHCVGITLDPERQHLYWTQKGPPKGGKGRIFRMALALPEGADPASRDDVTLLADHLPEPIDLHFCPASNCLYWTDRGAPPDGNSLNVAEVTADGLCNHRVIFRGLDEGIGLAIDPQEKTAFVSDLGGNIRRIDIASGEAVILRHQSSTTGVFLVPRR